MSVKDQEADLIINAGRVFCAATGLNGPGGVAIKNGIITKSGPNLTGKAEKTLDFPEDILLPGLVDLHTHPAPSNWRFGTDPDTQMLARGSTTVLSQGDAGAYTWPQYRDNIIHRSQTRIRLAISPSVKGEMENRGAFINLNEINTDACVSAIEEGGNLIWGISVVTTSKACGENDPREIMKRTLEIAERTGRPILYGPRREPSDWPLDEQLKLLRPGDVLTYCFHKDAESILENGQIVDSAWQARERGILFDLALGKGTSDLGVAPEAIANGFLPDTVSSDIFKLHLGWTPPHDLPKTISRMIAIGMPEFEAFRRATIRPAEILGLSNEIGTLSPNASADIVILRWNRNAIPLAKINGDIHSGPHLEPVLTIRAGLIINP